MMLLFRGEEAVRKIRSVIGNICADRRGGETIRDTYGDLILDEHDQVRYFEPAVLASPTPEEAGLETQALGAAIPTPTAASSMTRLPIAPGETPQRTLVLIKPDNFRFATGRPGNVIDFLSRTGLYIVGIKVHRMSVAQAAEFYGPVREVLRTKLKDVVSARAKSALGKGIRLQNPAPRRETTGRHSRPLFWRQPIRQHRQIHVRPRPGRMRCRPSCSQPGTEKCIALIYEGVEAIRKIRDVLGPTDPSKAPPGSIRREFGSRPSWSMPPTPAIPWKTPHAK